MNAAGRLDRIRRDPYYVAAREAYLRNPGGEVAERCFIYAVLIAARDIDRKAEAEDRTAFEAKGGLR